MDQPGGREFTDTHQIIDAVFDRRARERPRSTSVNLSDDFAGRILFVLHPLGRTAVDRR